MAKKMITTAVIAIFATVCFSLLYSFSHTDVWLSLAVTFGTISYHFGMRLLVGLLFDLTMKNRADYSRKWFQVAQREQRLYKKWKVKVWKDKMPTFDTDVFDPAIHSWDEIAQATCQSELVHETIMVFSFLPIIASIWFGSLPVFIITSALGALIDLIFVCMQRYNRPRILRMLRRSKKREQSDPT